MTLKDWRCVPILVVLSCCVASEAATPLPADAYGRLPAYSNVEISQGGKYIAAKVDLAGEFAVVVYQLPITQTSTYWAQRFDDVDISWITWANDERLLVGLKVVDHVDGMRVPRTRLISMNRDGSKIQNMVRRPKTDSAFVDQFEDDVLNMLPEDPDHILMAFSRDAQNNHEPEVRKVNVYTGKNTLIEGSMTNISDWMTDRDGNVRIAAGIHNEKVILRIRESADGDWRDVSYRLLSTDDGKHDDNIVFTPLGFDSDPNVLYVLSNHDSQTASVYRYDIREDRFLDSVYGRDDVDIDGLLYDSTGREVVGLRYTAEEPEVHYLKEDQDTRLREQISQAFDGADVRIQSLSYDNMQWIVTVSGDQLPRQYLYLDKRSGGLKLFGQQYPELTKDRLSAMQVTSYTARDGLVIPAYITLPPDIAELANATKEMPFIVLPHGGPTSRDFKRFDFLAQFLASRGYGVLQMNFRGSAGYGQTFELAGHREWGQAMQDDITDGTNWLVEQGYADPDRICIVGWSYGAYAALMGSVKTPNMYRCAAGIAGVYDLKLVLRGAGRYMNGKFLYRHIGRLWSDRDMLAAHSPAQQAGKIRIPVMLVHASDDVTVDVRQSRVLNDALSAAGHQAKYLEFDSGGHSLTGTERIEMLSALERFLAKNLGQSGSQSAASQNSKTGH